MKLAVPLPEKAVQQWHPIKNVLSHQDVTAGSGKKVWWQCELGHEWESVVKDVAAGRGCPFCAGNRAWPGFNDLLSVKPELATEWHPTKNDVPPDKVTYGSKKRVWWVGSTCGHEWEATINSRSSSAHGCPFCAGQKILVGFNDLASTHPLLAQEWDDSKNIVAATAVTSGNAGKFWWKCSQEHSYEAYLVDRKAGSSCFYCNGNKILTGFNDLATVSPEVMDEWDYVKNVDVDPAQVSSKSIKKAWWICPEGHSYELSIRARVQRSHESACHFCSGSRILSGHNDLVSTHPDIAKTWDYEKNIIPITLVSKGLGGKFWWVCETGNHSYQCRPTDRISGTDCNICSNHVVLPGFNDLVTSHPVLATEWHPTKNSLSAEDVTAGSSIKVWWLCDQGHEWLNSPQSRKKSDGSVTQCMECLAKTFTSQPEKDIVLFLEALGEKVVTNSRKLLKGTELDIYLPERKLAVEYNGLYWHTESRKGKKHHYEKWLKCEVAGVQLIQIREDEWLKNKDLVLRSIQHKLGVSNSKRVYARMTSVKQISLAEARMFLEANHIQGFASGSYYLGLADKNDEVQAVMVLRKERVHGLSIVRYATSSHVVGGFSKLLKIAEDRYHPDFFVTFADHSVSNGSLYADNGFVADGELRPDYTYVVRKERKHKFGYRLKRFRDDPMLEYVEGYTERQLADLNGIARIWDAGKTRWVKQISMTVDKQEEVK